MAFISLLIVCSASWFIKNYTDGLYQWPKEQTDESSRQKYIDEIAEDTLADYFTTGGVYQGHDPEDALQKPTITAKGAIELYGYTKNEGESDADFLARIANDVSKDYEVVWEAGVYCNLKDGDKPREIPAGEGYAHLRGRVAGSHYYRIVDKATSSVICYKHKVTITQDTLKAPVVNEPRTPLFAYDDITYGATWAGSNNSGRFTFEDVTVNVATFMTDEGKAFENSHFITSTKTLTLEAVKAEMEYEQQQLLVNNYSNANDTAINAIVDYTFLATAYSSVQAGTKTYYGTIVQALEATDNIGADGKEVTETSAGTNVVALQTASYSYTYTDADGVEQTKTVEYPHGKKVDGVGYTHVIDKNCVVGANVTFRIPNGIADDTDAYDKSSGNTGLFYVKGGSTSDDTAYYNKAYDVNVVTIAKDRKLENNGTIIIDAVVSGGGSKATYSSIVSGPYGRLTLDSKAQLINNTANSKINCYGFIDEVSENNGSLVEVNNGTVLGILSVVEHRTGYVFMGMVNPNSTVIQNATTLKLGNTTLQNGTPYSPTLTTFPFHRFFIQSVSVKMNITSSASYRAVANLYANSSQNETTVDFIGGATSFIFGVSGNSYVENKFKHNEDATKRGHDIDVYGSSSFNPMTLTLTTQKAALDGAATGIIVINLKTSGTLFPISHYFDINFKKNGNSSATVTMTGQDVKILPGGKVTVDAGVTVNAGKIAVYKDNSMLNGNASYTIPDGETRTSIQQQLAYPADFNTTGGELIVNGTLNVGSIGGTVKSTVANAKLEISSATSVVSPELMTTYKEKLQLSYMFGLYKIEQDYYAAVFSNDTDSTIESSGLIYNDAKPTAGQSFAVGTKYVSTKYGDEFAWFDPNVTITYDLGYDGKTESVTYTATADGGIGAFKTFTRKDHVFAGWFVDSAYDTPAPTAAEIRYSTTLYAKWEEIETYTITYLPNYPADAGFSDAEFSGGIEEAPAGTFTQVHTLCNWNTDTSIMYDRPYYFLGWSEENDGTVDESFTVTENGLTLHAVWGEKVSLKYTANDTSVYTSLITNGDMQLEYGKEYWFVPGTKIILPDVTANDKISNTNQYYFGGWTLENYSGGEEFELNDSVEINITWLKKATVNLNYYNGKVVLELVDMKDTITTDSAGDTQLTPTYYVRPGTLKLTYKYDETYKQTFDLTVTVNGNATSVTGTKDTSAKTITYQNSIASTDTWSLDADSDPEPSTCLVEGTLITLVDGTQKRIEDITADDLLLVFNHETGRFEARKIDYISHIEQEADNYRVLNLVFSNGAVLRIVGVHGLYDCTLNKYVYVNDSNVSEYLNHRFYMAEFDGENFVGGEVELIDAYVTEELVRVYSPITLYTQNCFASNMLTITPLRNCDESLINIFDFDENMMFDMDKKQEDLDIYGVYSYEDFAEYYSEEEFEFLVEFADSASQFFKIQMAKGRVDKEDIVELFDYILPFMPT